ncbi:hypothetical protein BD413DRAFT_74772 [Trametes elegans]|nr:hypothetical protein BD413DRAFT_74772 [Trametes elegans]
MSFARFTTHRAAVRRQMATSLRSYATGTSGEQHANRVAGGLKATLHNPKVSDTAKERASERLEELEGSSHASSHPEQSTHSSAHHNHVIGGFKATINNPHTSEKAKQHARDILAEDGIHTESQSSSNGRHTRPSQKVNSHDSSTTSSAGQHPLESVDEDHVASGYS